MKTQRGSFAVKILSGVLSTAILLLSPGLECYQALAAGMEAPVAGKMTPAIAFGRMHNLFAPESMSRIDGMVLNGVDVRELLSGMAQSENMTPEIRRILNAASDEAQTLEFLAAAAARVRAEVDDLQAVEQRASAQGDAGEMDQALKRIEPYRALLDRDRSLQEAAARARIDGYKRARIELGVKRAIQDWRGKIEMNLPATASESRSLFDVRGKESASLETGLRPVSALRKSTEMGDAQARGLRSVLSRQSSTSLTPAIGKFSSLSRKFRGTIRRNWKTTLAVVSAIAAGAAIAATGGAVISFPVAAYSAALISGILVHEVAHLWMARKLGDYTAQRHGHGSLNPFKHVDSVGTVVVPILSLLAGAAFLTPILNVLFGTAFASIPLLVGWSKPIPVDYNKLADPKKDSAKVALAGPAANAAAALLAWVAKFLLIAGGVISAGGPTAVGLTAMAVVNLGLALFNLLAPLPHADGFKLAIRYWPQKLYQTLWTRNPSIQGNAYQGIFGKLYEGPARPLSWAKRWMSKVVFQEPAASLWINRSVWGASVAVFSVVSWVGYLYLGLPLVGIALACSQAYYCIYEKVQSEEAVEALKGIFNGWALLAAEFSEKGFLHSEIDTERFENILAEVLDGELMDQVIDSEGFDGLDNDQKWGRLEEAFISRAISELKRDPRGLPDAQDTPELIRKVLFESREGRQQLQQLRDWFEREWNGLDGKERNVWARWRSAGRKKKDKPSEESEKRESGKSRGAAGKILGIAALAVAGSWLLGPYAGWAAGLAAFGFMGSIQPVSAPPREPLKPFKELLKEAAKDAALSPEDQKQELSEIAFLAAMIQRGVIAEISDDDKPVVGRAKQTDKIVRLIGSRRGDISGMVLVGKAGVGKTAIVRKIIHSILASRKEGEDSTFRRETLENRYYLALDPVALQLEDSPVATLKRILDLLPKFNERDEREGSKIVLLIDEIHALFKGPSGALIKDVLKKPLEKGNIVVIGGTTTDEYNSHIRGDEALKRRLQLNEVEEYTVPESLRTLKESKGYYEKRYGVEITADALKAAAENSHVDQELYLPGRAFDPLINAARDADYQSRRARVKQRIEDKMSELKYLIERLEEEKLRLLSAPPSDQDGPDNAQAPSVIDLENAAADLVKDLVGLYHRLRGIPTTGTPLVDEGLVNDMIVEKTGVESSQLTLGKEDNSKYLRMEEALNEVVVGQGEAVGVVSDAVRRSKSGMHDSEDEPMGVFMVTGPTGTGKTHFAKKLAEFLFGDEKTMIRFDMSEYMHSHETAKLIGSPNGYVGYEEGGQLTEAVRKRPNSVLLFDEIEKSNPAAWMILLQVFSDGRLTDNHGRTVSFKNTLILMSSNLGMMALDLSPYVAEYERLKDEWRKAEGDIQAREAVDRRIQEFGGKMAREIRAQSVALTQEAMTQTFPPEFRGRLQYQPIVFNPITPEMAARIVPLELDKLRKKLRRGGNDLQWPPEPEVVKLLIHEGFSVTEGARPLRNVIKNLVESPISIEILKSVDAAPLDAEGRKIRRKLLVKLRAERGRITVHTEPLPVEPKTRKPPTEAATLNVFTRVLAMIDQAVRENAAFEWTSHTLDAWIREALKALEPPEPAPQVQAPSSGGETANAQSSPAQDGAAVVADHAPAFLIENQALLLPPMASSVSRARNSSGAAITPKAFRKDAEVKILRALMRRGYSKEIRKALLSNPKPENPYEGFLRVILGRAIEQGSGKENPHEMIRWRIDDEDARIVIHRSGTVDDAEARFLRQHFTGPAPSSEEDSRNRAETLNNLQADSTSRLYFELYRILSAIPGAQIGYSSDEASGTDYWIKIPRLPASSPQAPSSGGETANAQSPPAQEDGAAVATGNASVPPSSPQVSDPSSPQAISLRQALDHNKIVRFSASEYPSGTREREDLLIRFNSHNLPEDSATWQRISDIIAPAVLPPHWALAYQHPNVVTRYTAGNVHEALSKIQLLIVEPGVMEIQVHPELYQRLELEAAETPAPRPEESALLVENQPLEMHPNDPTITPSREDFVHPVPTMPGFYERAAGRISGSLRKRGRYSKQIQDALLKDPSTETSHNGFLGLFLTMAVAKDEGLYKHLIRVRYAMDLQDVRIVVHRSGMVDRAEAWFLRRHFTGPVPSAAEDLRHRAEVLNNTEPGSADADYFELYRILSAIPGAQIGYSSKETSGTDYWIKIPRLPASSPQAPSSGGETANAQPSSPRAPDPAPPQPMSLRQALDDSKIVVSNLATTKFMLSFHSTVLREDWEMWSRLDKLLPPPNLPSETRPDTTLPPADNAAYYYAAPDEGTLLRIVKLLAVEPGVGRIQVSPEIYRELELEAAETSAHPTSGPDAASPVKGPSAQSKIAAFDAAQHPQGPGRVYIQVAPGADVRRAVTEAVRALGISAVPMFPRLPGNYQAFINLENAASAVSAAMSLAAQQVIRAVFIHPEAMEILRSGSAKAFPASPASPQDASLAHGKNASAPGFSMPWAGGADGGLKEYLFRLLDQGSERTASARYAAAETLAAVAGPEDLAWARGILSDPTKRDDKIFRYYPEVAAAALILGRHGRSQEDQELISSALRAAQELGGAEHVYKPLQSLLVQAWVDAIKPQDEAQRIKIKEEYKRERILKSNPLLTHGLYLALARYGGRDSEAEGWLIDDWDDYSQEDHNRIIGLYRHLKEADPAYLQNLYEKMRDKEFSGDGSSDVPGLERQADLLLAWYAAADFSSPEDAPKNIEKLLTMLQDHIPAYDVSRADVAGEALARLAKRFHLHDSIKSTMRRWLELGFSIGNERNLQAALQVISRLATDEDDERLMEDLMKTMGNGSYSRSDYVTGKHEINQQESAVAWAKIAVRSGRIENYLLPRETDANGGPISRIEKMLLDRNVFMNKAALEALKLYRQVRQRQSADTDRRRNRANPPPAS